MGAMAGKDMYFEVASKHSLRTNSEENNKYDISPV